MGFLGRIIRFLFWVLIVSWAVKLLGRAIGGMKRDDASSEPTGQADETPKLRGKRLVKDPVCGVHIAEELALPANADGELRYFCSEECRAKFQSRVLRRVANA